MNLPFSQGLLSHSLRGSIFHAGMSCVLCVRGLGIGARYPLCRHLPNHQVHEPCPAECHTECDQPLPFPTHLIHSFTPRTMPRPKANASMVPLSQPSHQPLGGCPGSLCGCGVWEAETPFWRWWMHDVWAYCPSLCHLIPLDFTYKTQLQR